MVENRTLPENGGSRPIPDPTRLTTEAVDRGIASLEKLFSVRFDSLTDDIKRLETQLDARPAAIITEIDHLSALMNEKFAGVADQFAGRDTALAAALLAQKTSVDDQNKANALAVSKSDAAVTKQIDAIGAQISATAKSSDDKIDDLKSRVQAIEGHSKGATDSWGWIVGAIGAAGALAAVVALLITMSNTEPQQVIVDRPTVAAPAQ